MAKNKLNKQKGRTRKNINRSNKKKSAKSTNKKYVIGIIAVPLSPDKKYFKVCGDSYVASSHIDWLHSQGVEILTIPYDTKNLEDYFKKCHGLYLPSGGAFAGTQMTYYRCCKKLLKLAMNENDKGNFFPVWGCCMGFQQMLILADGNDNVDTFLQKFDSYDNYFTNIDFTDEGKKSRFVNGISKRIYNKMATKKSTVNNHKLGISPRKFNANPRVSSFYKNIGTSKDRQGREFVAIIEAYHYPFWGVQWHPERNGEMKDLVRFFCDELKRSKMKKVSRKTIKKFPNMTTKRIDCMNFSSNLYKQCNFYWHKKSSSHNKRLCNLAQLKDTDNPDGTSGGV